MVKPLARIGGCLISRTVLSDRLRPFSAYERMSTALTAAQVFCSRLRARHYVCRASGATWPDAQREVINGCSANYAIRSSACRLPSRYQYAGRGGSLQVGLTARDTVLINQIIGFIGFQARGWRRYFRRFAVCPCANCPAEMQRCRGRAVSKRTIWRPAASLVEYPPAHTKNSAAIFVFTMPNDSAGTHPRSVFIRVTRTHTPTAHYTLRRPLLYFHLSRSSHHVSAAAPP